MADTEFDGTISLPPRARGLWNVQAFWRALARKIGDIATVMHGSAMIRDAIFILSLFMIVYPIAHCIRDLRHHSLTLSLHLWLMFVGGFFGMAMARKWHHD